MLSWSDVEGELVEAVKLFWRMPSGRGRWPFASDGPWSLITRLDRAGSAMEAWRQEQDDTRERAKDPAASVPLTAEEVTWMEKRLSWLLRIRDEDRKLVELALRQQAAGAERIDWLAIKARLSAEIGNKGLYRRYSRAIGALTQALNAEAESAGAGANAAGLVSGAA